jgi:hypothetical protein
MTSPRGPQPPVPPRAAPNPQRPQQPAAWAPPPARGYPAQGFAYPPGYAPPQGAAAQPPGYPPAGYGYAAPPGARPPVRSVSHLKVLLILGVALVVAVGAFVVISHFVTPSASTAKQCNPTCGGPPPVGPAVISKPTFTAADGSWSVEYPTGNPNFSSFKKTSDSLLADLGNGAAAILVRGGSAGGKTPQQVVQAYQQATFPDARPSYEISHAEVGYNPGYGAVFDDFPQTTSGSSQHMRLIVLAAVRNDTYVLVVGLGAYQQFAKDGTNDGHPSGAATVVSFFMDPIINSVTWKGDPAR